MQLIAAQDLRGYLPAAVILSLVLTATLTDRIGRFSLWRTVLR
jgi:hypothetical protein